MYQWIVVQRKPTHRALGTYFDESAALAMCAKLSASWPNDTFVVIRENRTH